MISHDQNTNRVDPLVSEHSFWRPNYLTHESAWLEHAPFAFWLINAHRPTRIVELGTYCGYSHFAFCQAALQLDKPAKCYAIDTWEGDQHAGYYPETVYERVVAYNASHYATISTLVRSTFDQALDQFENGSIDLLHIDGNHYYEDVKHDFLNWLPKMSSKGVVMFHDTQVRDRDFGVFQFWSEVASHYPHFEFFHGFGLGVLGVGADLGERVSPLFHLSENAEYENYVRHFYAQAGRTISQEVFAGLDEEKLVALAQDLKMDYEELISIIAEFSQSDAIVLDEKQ